MPYYTINYQLPSGDRAQKRTDLIKMFINEEAGSGNKDLASRYRYNVDSYDGYSIYLKRPTQLNKGFDFTVNIEGLYFKKSRRYSNPSHQDIVDSLLYCQEAHPQRYHQVKSKISSIYDCKDIDLIDLDGIYFVDYEDVDRPIQIILLAIKWLFMEQDCAYWNYSGRRMFFERLKEEGLV